MQHNRMIIDQENRLLHCKGTSIRIANPGA